MKNLISLHVSTIFSISFLRHIMDFQLGGSTRSPQLPYNFINKITNNYKVLKANYEHDLELLLNENPGWRDDFRFLYQLFEAFKLTRSLQKTRILVFGNCYLPAENENSHFAVAFFHCASFFIVFYVESTFNSLTDTI